MTNPGGHGSSTAYFEGLFSSLSRTAVPPYNVMTLWQSYKEGEAYVMSAGTSDPVLMRAAFKRLATRVSIAMAFVMDERQRTGGGCPVYGTGPGSKDSCGRREARSSDVMRYVTVFPMMCFGPLLELISSGDSRMLILLFHIYHVVGVLLYEEKYWWCKTRVEVMQKAIWQELRKRGLRVCLMRQSEVV
jgi:hypothetical protein